MQKEQLPNVVILRDNLKQVKNIKNLPKIGAGHDGIVYKYQNKVLKLLKYDISHRKQQNLMTFEKAIYFHDKLTLQKITKPTDILLNKDGIYVGYVMDYLEDITKKTNKTPGDFTCEDLLESTKILKEDTINLTENKVAIRDINRGSYIYTESFLNICDMDKYTINDPKTKTINNKALNFIIAKLLYYEMLKKENISKEDIKKLSTWVKKSSNDLDFLIKLEKDLKGQNKVPLTEYTNYKIRKII